MKRSLANLINVLIALLAIAALVLAYLYGNKLFDFDNDQKIWYSLLAVVGFFFALPFHSFMHEIFHLLAGKAAGMKFNRINIGALTFYRQGGKIKFRLSGKSRYAGYCSMIFVDSKNMEKRYAMHTAGGLIGSFLHFALSLIILLLGKAVGMYVYAFFAFQLPVAAYMLFLNSIPQGSQAGLTDGAVIVGILKKNPQCVAAMSIMQLQTQVFAGKTPSEVADEFYDKLPSLPEDDPLFFVVNNWKYLRALSAGDWEEAIGINERMQGLIEFMPEVYKENLISDFVYDASALKKDRGEAEKYYGECKNFLEKEEGESNLRIRAAYALYVEKDTLKARRLVSEAETCIKSSTSGGIAIMESKLIQKISEDLSKAEKVAEAERERLMKNRTHIFKPRPGDLS